jgi:hypothetical protein
MALLEDGYIEPEFMPKLRSIPGLENAVIAGGWIRDTLIGVQKNDIDIFFPGNIGNVQNTLKRIQAETEIEINDDGGGLYILPPPFFCKVDATYKGQDIDLVGYNIPNDENFGDSLIKTFYLNIDKVYSDKDGLVITKDFMKDYYYGEITYSGDVSDTEKLLSAHKKFLKLSNKYPISFFNYTSQFKNYPLLDLYLDPKEWEEYQDKIPQLVNPQLIEELI